MKSVKSAISLLVFLAGLNTVLAQRYVFYLHGRIVEVQGANAVDTINGYGPYQYKDILDSIRSRGFVVLSEVRSVDTQVEYYAQKIRRQIDSLLQRGVEASRITVIGASKGALIAMHIATLVADNNVNYVLLAACNGSNLDRYPAIHLSGNVLSIYERSDMVNTTCIQFKNRAVRLNHYKELEINTGLKHGFLYKPLSEWLVPALTWAGADYR